jgi:predicted ferric reductase
MSARVMTDGWDEAQPAYHAGALLSLLLAILAGVFAAVFVLPAWLPDLSASLLGPEPKAYWHLSRASALVAFALLWLALALGLTITSRLARLWPGGPAAFDLHQHASLLGLALALVHALILTGDRYMSLSLAQVVVPFATTDYRPVWVGLGQIAFYLLAAVGLSFYVRRWLGRRTWRAIHFLSFLLYLLVLAHGVASGTDSEAPVVAALYWGSGVSLLLLTVWRVVTTVRDRRARRSRRSLAATG